MANNLSAVDLREGRINYSDSFFDFWKKWLIDLNSTWIKALNSYDYTDWKMFFPKAFWLNWSDPKTWEKEIFNPAIWLPSIYSSPDERSNIQGRLKVIGDYVGGHKIEGDYAGRDINKKA